MLFSYEESDRSAHVIPRVRVPRIRIAVPSMMYGVTRRPKAKLQDCAHSRLLDQFRGDMDGFMPQSVSRRRALKR